MIPQTEKEFYITMIASFVDENEELKRDRDEWQTYHNEVVNYLNKVILDLDKENAILRKELSKYENQ